MIQTAIRIEQVNVKSFLCKTALFMVSVLNVFQICIPQFVVNAMRVLSPY